MIYVEGTNGGKMPCGAMLTAFGRTEPYFCQECCAQRAALPPVDHAQGFGSKDEIRAYLAAFADRPGTDIVGFDLWGRPTTFDDLRALVREPQQSLSFQFEESLGDA